MEFLSIGKRISEQMPLLVSGCMGLRGIALHPNEVESVVIKDKPIGFSTTTCVDIYNYATAVDFISACKEQKYHSLNGNLIATLATFLMRRIAVNKGYVRDGVDITAAVAEMNEMFALQQGKNLPDFLRDVADDFMRLQFLAEGNEALLYLIINFYLSIYKNVALVFTDISNDAPARFQELTDWVEDWKG